MNSENIKALIELFGNLGASSKEAFLWFIALEALKEIMFFAAVFTVITLIYKLIRKAMNILKMETTIIKLRDLANLGSGCLAHYEIDRVVEHYSDLEKKRREG